MGKKRIRIKGPRHATGGKVDDLYIRRASKNIRNTGPRRELIERETNKKGMKNQ